MRLSTILALGAAAAVVAIAVATHDEGYAPGDRVIVPIAKIAGPVAQIPGIPPGMLVSLILQLNYVSDDQTQARGDVVGYQGTDGVQHLASVPAGLGPFGFAVSDITAKA